VSSPQGHGHNKTQHQGYLYQDLFGKRQQAQIMIGSKRSMCWATSGLLHKNYYCGVMPRPKRRMDLCRMDLSQHIPKDYSSLQLHEKADRQTFSDLNSEFSLPTFCFRHGSGVSSMTLEASNPPVPTGWLRDPLKNWNSLKKRGLKPISETQAYFTSIMAVSPFSHQPVHRFSQFFLSLLFASGIHICIIMNRNAQAEEWNYAVPLSPNIYIIVSVFVQICHLPVDATDLQHLSPPKGFASPRSWHLGAQKNLC
jgi:hypothetical protein